LVGECADVRDDAPDPLMLGVGHVESEDIIPLNCPVSRTLLLLSFPNL
jgi:hypothetical protein